MAILPQIEERDASPKVREAYQKVKARYGGFLPDIYKAFANDPEYLDSINDHMARVLKPRKVDERPRRSSRSWSPRSTTATSACMPTRAHCGACSVSMTKPLPRSLARSRSGPR